MPEPRRFIRDLILPNPDNRENPARIYRIRVVRPSPTVEQPQTTERIRAQRPVPRAKSHPLTVARGPVPRDATTTKFATVELATEPPIQIAGTHNGNAQPAERVTVAIRPVRIDITSPVGETSGLDAVSRLNGIIQAVGGTSRSRK